METKFKFEIITHLGSLSKKGEWSKELNYISWNGNDPKYDIRDWTNDHTKMGKGVTLNEQEIRELFKVLQQEVEFLDNE